MALQAFSDNFSDNSTEAGFQFTFFCDLCKEGYKTEFIASKTYKRAGLFKGVGKLVSLGASIAGESGRGRQISRGTDILTNRHQGMSPKWHKEHEKAFEQAQNEAKGHFYRCPKCKKWVCEMDWNEQEGLCVDCAPRINVEIAAAKSQKAIRDIKSKAATTQVFTGEIESKQTLCPRCGKPAGEGKFCNNCGASLELIECPKCGAKNAIGTRFCGECGTNMIE